ncbi:MAG: 23S rRNA (adenine(2030)-N(6))-methyltransferase RlmJ [Zetaproteobacteria bacterium]|nr:23S rRNA (adenine(2030)-N(6))-methyltransferase RlmJ [Zetaproteobacteria bacterium]
MLSYQHGYHAGNHADILKHIVVGEIITAMQIKPTPMMMFDGFAGRGLYDLSDAYAQKTGEYQAGVASLWPLLSGEQTSVVDLPSGVKRWFEAIQHYNTASTLRFYPGSTALMALWQRDVDRVIASDLHPQEFQALRGNFRDYDVALHQRDAYEALGAFLPPKEHRGLIFLDPSFEDKREYKQVARAVIAQYARFPMGVYAIWYPILPAAQHEEIARLLTHSAVRNVLQVEMWGDFSSMQMQGSGLYIVNPPWHALEAIRASLTWLAQAMTSHAVVVRFHGLIPE